MNRKVHAGHLQLAHAPEQAFDLVAIELRGRLVEDDEAGAIGERAGDLDQLARLDPQVAGARVLRDGDVPAVEQLARLAAERRPADQAALVGCRLMNRFSATVSSGMMVEC